MFWSSFERGWRAGRANVLIVNGSPKPFFSWPVDPTTTIAPKLQSRDGGARLFASKNYFKAASQFTITVIGEIVPSSERLNRNRWPSGVTS